MPLLGEIRNSTRSISIASEAGAVDAELGGLAAQGRDVDDHPGSPHSEVGELA